MDNIPDIPDIPTQDFTEESVKMRIVLADNDDSFTRNLEHLLVKATDAEVTVVPYGEFGPESLRDADVLVISPGPGHPEDYPKYSFLFDPGTADVPVLGVCLGMQIMNEALGGRTERLEGCVHGKSEEIEFYGKRIRVARYHSLHVAEVAPGCEVVARNDGGVPMCLRHPRRPFWGYQFHPESFLTERGESFIHHAFAQILAM